MEAVETAAVVGPHTNSLTITKTYADNSTVTYTYTPDNLPLRTTYASGRWKENVYDERRKVVAVEYSDGETVSLAYDAFLNEIAFSNDVAAANLDRDEKGNCTNDTAVVGNETKTIARTYDAFRRLTGIDGTIYDYNADGLLASISNDIALVEYAYTPDRLDAGYSLTLSNGVVFTRSLVRDGYRRSLVSGISSVANGVGVGSLAYTYDALNRPTSRNNDSFGYNARGEVVFSRRGAEIAEESYSYDDIGNLLLSALNTATNTYTANNLNQYTSILRASASPCEVIHDADGNMLSDGNLSFTYDAANRLKTVSSNGVLLVTNFYDAKSRRVKKVTQDATMTFFYDGWNLVEERISYTNGTTTTIHYFWGKDLSGTLQGAGGVGGLLYLTIDGVPYIPDYDNIGNITRYLDANGNVVAQYTYDAFGGTLSQSGSLASFFRHRFSTKYLDVETGLYYYGYRFYCPNLGRWLNRDPIDEEGGENLYRFCRNSSVTWFDMDGRFVLPILITPDPETPQPYPSPDPVDQLGSDDSLLGEENWFQKNYAGWLAHSKALFIAEINAGIDCKGDYNGKSSRQSIDPGIAGYIPWEMPAGGSDRLYGDRGQNNFQAVAVLGKFVIDYVTPVRITYEACVNNKKRFSWVTTMYVEDSLGLQGDEGILKYFTWAAKSRRVKRAEWKISGSGFCSCCD